MKRIKARNLRGYPGKSVGAVNPFPDWSPAATYAVDQYVRYNGALYRCLQAHTAQTARTPTTAPSLWAKIPLRDWEQRDSANAYKKGDLVLFEGRIYKSLIDNNTYSPAGQAEVAE